MTKLGVGQKPDTDITRLAYGVIHPKRGVSEVHRRRALSRWVASHTASSLAVGTLLASP
jgi:hypothetical protein